MAFDPILAAHKEWQGYLQPEGLVVSPQVLADNQVVIDRSALADVQERFLEHVDSDAGALVGPFLARGVDNLARGFAIDFLGWGPADIDLAGEPDAPHLLDPNATVSIPELRATLTPTAALRAQNPEDPTRPYLLFTKEYAPDTDLDSPRKVSQLWEPTPSTEFERLLTETGVPLGVLSNGRTIRLFYAPKGESAGHLSFDVAHMLGTAGRPIVAALHTLLNIKRFTNQPGGKTLLFLCTKSREYQSKVSDKLSKQVLEALYELVRGFQDADGKQDGALLGALVDGTDDQRQDIYRGLLRTLMRSVFVLFAEDRGLLPTTGLYTNNYSLHGLYERLRVDDGKHHDTMDSRYGAWAQMLTLFRLIHGGGRHPELSLPPRHGYLFDPDAFPFLEGRSLSDAQVPLVSDGCVHRVLEKLLILDGERLSYRTLDVEQIGSVYETMIGFTLAVADAPTLAIRPTAKHGAATGVNLELALAESGAKRSKYIENIASTKLTARQKKEVEAATDIDALVAALAPKVAVEATPRPVQKGSLLLQPNEDRRKSGSHYTPRSLTEPIVRKTLEPLLARLEAAARLEASAQPKPVTPEQLLDLKICDPAMGSGAFLVEVCRQLGKRLEQAWIATNTAPPVSAEDDLYRLACRTVAQRCLYGVDRNDMAVDLAKLSLWLVTLARDHSFTFLDHALRHGDSLVGLDQEQLGTFHWSTGQPRRFVSVYIAKAMDDAARLRARISEAAGEGASNERLTGLLAEAEGFTARLRAAADFVVIAFFDEERPGRRQVRLDELAQLAQTVLEDPDGDAMLRMRARAYPTLSAHRLMPFHWPLCFPEVFESRRGGFDCMVGNPPFLGGPQITERQGSSLYQEWLKASHEPAFGNADLCAYFVRRAFKLTRAQGTIGFITTNSIREGGSRTTSLQPIIAMGGRIYSAQKTLRWPGNAAVTVSVVHLVVKSDRGGSPALLDGKSVPFVNSRLLPSPEASDPEPLHRNLGRCFMGAGLGGSGFILDPSEAQRLLQDTRNHRFLWPYLGGEEVATNPDQRHNRFAINFGSITLNEAGEAPDLLEIVRERVKPARDRARDHGPGNHGRKYWWQFTLRADPLYRAIGPLSACFATPITAKYLLLSRQPTRQVFAHSLEVFAFDDFGHFAAFQSRVHEVWARLLASSMGMTMRYSVNDCHDTFPLPSAVSQLVGIGSELCVYRDRVALIGGLGLTELYNEYHDKASSRVEIVELRRIHERVDRAVLDAYGWKDIPTNCEFIPDYFDTDDEGNETPASIRYRWPDEVRDEVLARLLELNEKRYREEVAAGLHAKGGKRSKSLFDEDDDA